MLNNREKFLFVFAVMLISLFLIMPHSFALYTRTYNFSGIQNVSTTHKANYTIRNTSTLSNTYEFGTGPQASGNNYTQVTSSDNIRAIADHSTSALDVDNETGHFFEFKLEEPKTSITNIRIVWEGSTSVNCADLPAGLDAMSMYIYNFSSNTWKKDWGGCSNTDTTVVLTLSKSASNVSYFVSSAGLLRISVNTSQDSAVGVDDMDTRTDYIAVNITSNFKAVNPPDLVAMNITPTSIYTNQQNSINISVDVIKTGNITRQLYDFSGITTPSSTHLAKYLNTTSTNEFGTGQSATNNTYSNITSSDDIEAIIHGNTELAHWFEFKINESKPTIKNIRIAWEGDVFFNACPTDGIFLNIWLYNFSSNSWANSTPSADCPTGPFLKIITLNSSQNISDFINASGILRMSVNWTGSAPLKELMTDYVAANVSTISGSWIVNTTLYNVTPGGPDISAYPISRAVTGYVVYAAIAVDIDGDNDSDVVSQGSSGGGTVTTITTWQNPGNNLNMSTWTKYNRTLFTSNFAAYGLTAGDIDGDGDNDIISATSSGTNTIILFENPGNNLNISQWTTYNRSEGGTPSLQKLRVADLDSDGDSDIVYSDSGTLNMLSVFENNGNKNIATWAWNNETTSGGRFAIADLDDDGDNDIVIAESNNVSIKENTGTIDISLWPSYSRTDVGVVADDVEIGDLDGDGDYDIVVFDIVANAENITALHNPGGNPKINLTLNNWGLSKFVYGGGTEGSNLGSVIADFDSDGDLDIATGRGALNGPKMLNNTGVQNLTNWTLTEGGGTSNIIDYDFADFDLDGDLDILVANSSAGHLIIFNNDQVSSKYIDSQVINISNSSKISQLFQLNWTPTQTGNTRLYATVDGGGRIAEVLENNNFVSEAVSVSQGNLTINYITPTPNNETINTLWAFINASLSAAGSSATLEWNELTNYSMIQGTSNTNWYRNQTGLSNDTNYTFRAFANDLGGNTFSGKFRWVFINVTGEAPAPGGENLDPVTNLRETVTGDNWILWNWTNPTHPDFCRVEVSVNTTFKVNTTSTSYNFSGLVIQTYEIETKTFACNGTADGWANDSAYTSRCSY